MRALLFRAALLLQALSAAATPVLSAPALDGYHQLAAAQIGPWTLQAWNTRDGTFSGCTVHRVDDGVVASFGRGASGYNLVLGSDQWQLGEPSAQIVTLAAGSATALAEAHVTRRTHMLVILQRNPLLVPSIMNEFRRAGPLEVRIAGGTIRISSDQAAFALAELDKCWRERGSRIVTGSVSLFR